MSVVENALEKLRRNATGKSSPGSIATLEVQPSPDVAHTTSTPSAPRRRLVIDSGALRNEGYLPDSDSDRLFADFYRQIKRPLIARALAPVAAGTINPRLIMLTSALPGDGKTFTSINLALSMTRERDLSVLLVDGDVAKPHISKILGVSGEPGLLDAVSDPKIDVESLVVPTSLEGLSILPAGTIRGSEELLASAHMSRVVGRLLDAQQRRLVLFDTPPLLLSSESRALAALSGQLVLVVRSGKTLRQAVLDAISHVGEGHNLSLVLNQSRMKFTQSYYHYGAYGSDEDAF